MFNFLHLPLLFKVSYCGAGWLPCVTMLVGGVIDADCRVGLLNSVHHCGCRFYVLENVAHVKTFLKPCGTLDAWHAASAKIVRKNSVKL